jgi:ketosteroid isomerase-like protein
MDESERIELVRKSFEAYQRGDLDSLAEMAHPDFEVHDWPEAADPRVYRGAQAVHEARDEWSKAWEHVHAEPYGYVDLGDRVFVSMRTIGRGRGSSIEMQMDTYGIYTIRDSKVAKIQFFITREAALAAAGLTEEQLRQEAT